MWRSARAVSKRVSRRSFQAGTYHATKPDTTATSTVASGATIQLTLSLAKPDAASQEGTRCTHG